MAHLIPSLLVRQVRPVCLALPLDGRAAAPRWSGSVGVVPRTAAASAWATGAVTELHGIGVLSGRHGAVVTNALSLIIA